MRSVLQELTPAFEKASGHHLNITYGTAGEVERRLMEREPFDVGVATKPRIQTLEGDGTVVKGSVLVIGRSPIALAVKKGAPKPDIGSVEAFKQALLAAKSVAYTDLAAGGTSGIHMAGVFKRLGIADQLQPKLKAITGKPGAPPAVGEAVAHGEAELGLQPVSELMGTPGIDVVGIIPAELQTPGPDLRRRSRHRRQAAAGRHDAYRISRRPARHRHRQGQRTDPRRWPLTRSRWSPERPPVSACTPGSGSPGRECG